MKRFVVALLMGVIFIVPVSAQSYDKSFPPYVPASGGAWAEVATSQGRVTVVFPLDFRVGFIGFLGDGYSIANVTNSTISGTIYHQTQFGYYGYPDNLQCRLSRMGTLEVYEPYQSTYGSTSYRWTSLPTSEIFNTNIAFVDDKADRRNDVYRYDTTQKVLILIFCLLGLLAVGKVVRRAWRA